MPTETPLNHSPKISRRSFLFLSGAALASGLSIALPTEAAPIQVRRYKIAGVQLYQTTIDLTDPHTFIAIGLANNPILTLPQGAKGAESFSQMVARYHAAVVASGTFFSKDAQKRLMGNMVSAGQFLKYRPWEDFGTTLGIRTDKQLEMVTARVDGQPDWSQHWFSITAGPRLLKGGKVWVAPRTEGFADPRVMGVANRSAIGFPAGGKKLILVTFLSRLSLEREAQLMRKIGCYEAMNLDGGASTGLAQRGKILVRPQRQLTNVILVYDAKHPAPTAIKEAWKRFQSGERPSPNESLG